MSYRTLVGEKKALVFPVMCDAHIRLDYSNSTPNRQTISTPDDEPYGIFGWDDSFTLQTVLSPYDVNGLNWEVPNANNPHGTTGVTTSKKTMAGIQTKSYSQGSLTLGGGSSYLESELYIPITGLGTSRKTYEMMIFYNTNVQLSLINDTPTTSQPAEYKIKFTIVADGVSDSVTSDKVIIASSEYLPRVSTDYQTGGYDSASIQYINIGQMGTGDAGTPTRVTLASGNENEYFMVGESLYIMNPIKKVATITAVTSTYIDIVYEAGCSYGSDISAKTMYREAPKEALYLINPQNISVIFDRSSGRMSIFYNGLLVANKNHSEYPISSFSFSRTDSYIGSNDSGDFDATDRKQFMGELHELAIIEQMDSSAMRALFPNYRNTLLYFRFEEADE